MDKKKEYFCRYSVNRSLSREDWLSLYRKMFLIRAMELRLGSSYALGDIRGFCHLYIGQEAICVGSSSVSSDQDIFITGYRCHGFMVACGVNPQDVIYELYGCEKGSSKGRGGSMHMFYPEGNFYGGHGIVGSQCSLGVGLAFALKYRKIQDSVSFIFLGDGSMNQGQVYESLNMAVIWNLPVVIVIENNEYAMGTYFKDTSATSDLYTRGAGLGIEGNIYDGMCLLSVRYALDYAKRYVLENNIPYIVELKTYRYKGHSVSDPGQYRSKESVQKVKEERDPINNLKASLIKFYEIDEEIFKTIHDEVNKDLFIFFKKAKKEKECTKRLCQDLYNFVYIDELK